MAAFSYFGLPEKTAEVLDTDGWFHSGDLGKWVEGPPSATQYLTITGTNGRRFYLSLDGMPWVWPEMLEGYLRMVVEDIAIVGVQQKYLIALVYRNAETDTRSEAQILADIWKCCHEKEIAKYEFPIRFVCPFVLLHKSTGIAPYDARCCLRLSSSPDVARSCLQSIRGDPCSTRASTLRPMLPVLTPLHEPTNVFALRRVIMVPEPFSLVNKLRNANGKLLKRDTIEAHYSELLKGAWVATPEELPQADDGVVFDSGTLDGPGGTAQARYAHLLSNHW